MARWVDRILGDSDDASPSARYDDRGRLIVRSLDFKDRTFEEDVAFSYAVIGKACFDGATFLGGVSFHGSDFEESASFQGATFAKSVSFVDVTFFCPAQFAYISIDEAEEPFRYGEVTFGGVADFRNARFAAGADFGGAIFESRARFEGARFGTAEQTADGLFEGARFRQALTLGPMLAHRAVSLDRAIFEAPSVRIAVSAPDVSCVRTHFVGRAHLEARFASISLEDAEFAQPSIVGGSKPQFQLEDSADLFDDSDLRDRDRRPRIKSLARANVANLTLADCDLRECCFIGAHNLDGLRFEAVEFAWTKRPATVRRMIADERNDEVARGRLARTYRALRKGREDNKDEPGAADFYYGEMEMRRQASRGFERVLLAAYRAVSGYGLRASRAFAALAVTIVVGGAALAAFSGFDPDQGFGKSLLFSAESTSSLLRAPDTPDGANLNDEGHLLQLLVRLFGALFFGLALLALRGRVKR